MRRIFLTVAVATMMSFGLQAQNGEKSFNNDRERLDFKQNNRKVESYVIYKEIKNQPSASKNNHQFSLNIEGDWEVFAIGNGDDFFDLVYPWNIDGDEYQATLPEGLYDITISFFDWNTMKQAFIFFEQILVDKDTELTADIADAIYKVTLAPVDEDNNLIGDWAGWDSASDLDFFMHPSINAMFLNNVQGINEFGLYVNEMGTRNRFLAAVYAFEPTKSHDYYVCFDMIEDGISDNITLSNTVDELYCFKQMNNTTEDFLYSTTGYLRVFYDFETNIHGSNINTSGSPKNIRPKETPYTLYSNVKYNDTPQTGDVNTFVMPITLDFWDWENWQNDYRGTIAGNPMAMNNNGELIMNYVPLFYEFWFRTIEDINGSLGNNPLTKVWNEEEFYYEGFRTPILYHQAYNFVSETNRSMRNLLLFLGEFGEQKYNHGDMIGKITGDGTEIFNDSIFKLYRANDLDNTRSQYSIEITNDDVFAYGRKMTNQTNINFDMSKSDVNPPTLTMLRIIDNEKISMSVTDANSARLEITAGDDNMRFTEYGRFIAYDNNLDIEVFWSSDGETFYELPIQEDISKFHPGYGGFYDVSLAPLSETNLSNAWITVKIVLTDEVGNSQVQILNPLFFYGDLVGINETTISCNANSIAYPNPFNDKVTIELERSLSGETYFEIYDLTGRIIYQQKTEADNKKAFTWNGSYAKSGVYFYGIYNNGKIYKGKIVKQ